MRLEDSLHSEPADEARMILYRIAQEALTNARKHAQASEVDVLIREAGRRLPGTITDDGVGFVAEDTVPLPAIGPRGDARARREAGGRIRINSAPRTGTVVECWIPSPPDSSRATDAR